MGCCCSTKTKTGNFILIHEEFVYVNLNMNSILESLKAHIEEGNKKNITINDKNKQKIDNSVEKKGAIDESDRQLSLKSNLKPNHDNNNSFVQVLNDDDDVSETLFTKSTKLSMFQKNEDQFSYRSHVENDETFEKLTDTSFSKSLSARFNQEAEMKHSSDDENYQLPNFTKFLEIPENRLSKPTKNVIKHKQNLKYATKDEKSQEFTKHLNLLEKRFTKSAKNNYIRDRIENETSTIENDDIIYDNQYNEIRYGSSLKESYVDQVSKSSFVLKGNESSNEGSSNDSEDMAVLGMI